ncbi:MAG TPA: Eco57I restriction-modification methylase domain-containing protein [Burkholderiales bacterium]|nr:Eco57I restriction-modification methylase domain-containing protein [Burkholderiales bacterium]
MSALLNEVDLLRQTVATQTSRQHKSAMGQYMTPASIARFMANMFEPRPGNIRLLDAGAGLGALFSAVLDRWKGGELGDGSLSIDAFEIDKQIVEVLHSLKPSSASITIRSEDYLAVASALPGSDRRRYTHAILNPPYKKIGIGSNAREYARRVGLETVNLYSAFVAVAYSQLEEYGQLVAIIPRSFCNGPYYKPFRNFLLNNGALRHIHLFDSRTSAFRDDAVLQENVIILLERGGEQRKVKVSVSKDERLVDYTEKFVPFNEIVRPRDFERFIHIPTTRRKTSALKASISDLDLSVSTGPVVDFRLRDHLRKTPEKGTVPLIYPCHFDREAFQWPVVSKKPNAIARNDETERWLYPAGTYTVVRRFSSKEEKRRIVAGVIHASALPRSKVGFENHLNVFHHHKRGLDEKVAWGLYVYLNSTAVDEDFRRFNGHTQVNATDLRNITYPPLAVLKRLGAWQMKKGNSSQAEIDRQLEKLL